MEYYSKEKNDKIKCLLCRHYCKLKEGQVGVCGVNKNAKGELETLVYGHPIALNVDPVEKKPLYHVLPGSDAFSFGTVGCNFQCPFCQNWTISQEKSIDTTINIAPNEMINLASKYSCESIAYTYNEPTIFYPYAKDIGLLAREKGIKNLFISNGFETAEVVKDMASWLDAANIDLKSWNKNYYKNILKGGLEAIKETLKMMIDEGIWVEVTTLLIDGENDSHKDMEEMATFIADGLGRSVPWHLSAFHPDYKMISHDSTKSSTLLKAKQIAEDVGLHYVYLGNVSGDVNTYCPDCGELLIERTNYNVKKISIENGYCPKCGRKIAGIWS